MSRFSWDKGKGERLRRLREAVAGKRGRREFCKPIELPDTTLQSWESGRVKPDLHRLSYLLASWHLRLNYVMTGDGSPVQSHKLADAGWRDQGDLHYPLARFYVALMLRTTGNRRLIELGNWLAKANEKDLPRALGYTALWALDELLDRPTEKKLEQTDWDFIQLSSVLATQSQEGRGLKVAEALAEATAKQDRERRGS